MEAMRDTDKSGESKLSSKSGLRGQPGKNWNTGRWSALAERLRSTLGILCSTIGISKSKHTNKQKGGIDCGESWNQTTE